jgi:hypothetical protein
MSRFLHIALEYVVWAWGAVLAVIIGSFVQYLLSDTQSLRHFRQIFSGIDPSAFINLALIIGLVFALRRLTTRL